ncbi:MAG: ornithine cyclodeaminase family protein [Armatimonadota bacterium]|nr:ornithine cyclodeaminase family protein [Armatimonadota bacterium]MDR7427184.1 ornithine cyclodeaminase family protein [Armatimonadota bacterium]MDR7464992.1 ornithine cyclodeaminase family protein [Armatimonadota bacterium]MDR7473533.1 ornithine cyclodeaminase family protein [Armatimonadota bacterium]MDR7539988.1 ornithine cyclodeaminase family protein [Armatimonadota bacterium]
MAVGELRLVSAAELRQLVPMADAIDLVRAAFVHLSRGEAQVPLRVPLPGEEGGVTLFMPAAVPALRALGVKVVSVYPANPARGLPTITALVLVQDPATGAPLGLVEGAALTALRTGAAGGLAAQLLSRPDAHIVALFGAGVQGRTQLEAVFAVREITQVRVVARDPQRSEAFVRWVRAQPWAAGATVLSAASPELAVRGADIVITATTSPTPVVPTAEVAPGTHLTLIGAFTPQTREVDADLVARATVVVDSRAGCLAEAGDLLLAIAEGRFSAEQIHAEIGEVAAGLRPGRRHPEEVTLFKSVGTAALDVTVGAAALQRAAARGAGQVVRLVDGG